jgi:hypothetical protein
MIDVDVERSHELLQRSSNQVRSDHQVSIEFFCVVLQAFKAIHVETIVFSCPVGGIKQKWSGGSDIV